LALAQCALYLAVAPKSNAVYRAYGAVRKAIAERPADPVPKPLRNAPTRLMGEQGYGKGYVYAHDEPEGVGGIECLPDSLAGTTFYEPKASGNETAIRERLETTRRRRREAIGRRADEEDR